MVSIEGVKIYKLCVIEVGVDVIWCFNGVWDVVNIFLCVCVFGISLFWLSVRIVMDRACQSV